MTEAQQHRYRLGWQPIWLGLLLCLFLAASTETAKAHGLASVEHAVPAAVQPTISSTPSAAADHDFCPAAGQHGQHSGCAGQGFCYAAALAQDSATESAAARQGPAPRAMAGPPGGDVAPLFHPPRS